MNNCLFCGADITNGKRIRKYCDNEHMIQYQYQKRKSKKNGKIYNSNKDQCLFQKIIKKWNNMQSEHDKLLLDIEKLLHPDPINETRFLQWKNTVSPEEMLLSKYHGGFV